VDQGFITQSVTSYLNCAGGVCLIVWGVSLWFDTWSAPRWRRPSWALWWCLVAGLAVLMRLHLLMDRLLDLSTHSILDGGRVRSLHRAYLVTSTSQWLASLLLLGLTLTLWQLADREGSQTRSVPPHGLRSSS
jgi:hypothetical protein